jgi:hypothetical protein
MPQTSQPYEVRLILAFRVVIPEISDKMARVTPEAQTKAPKATIKTTRGRPETTPLTRRTALERTPQTAEGIRETSLVVGKISER